MLGFLCCLLLRDLLQVLLVGRFGVGLATTLLAAGASPVVLADARATTLLANIASSVMFAYACATTLLAPSALSVVPAYARATALFAS